MTWHMVHTKIKDFKKVPWLVSQSSSVSTAFVSGSDTEEAGPSSAGLVKPPVLPASEEKPHCVLCHTTVTCITIRVTRGDRSYNEGS